MSFPFEQFIQLAKSESKSEDYIKECISYAISLSEKSLPVIFSLEHLAITIGIQSKYLRDLLGESKNGINYNHEHKYSRYNYFKLNKRRGGFREIMSPSKDLKFIQKWILVNILSKYPLALSCNGFVENKSIFDNAKVHEKSDIILKIDLLKFYDTITEKRVYGVFKSLGYINNLAYTFAKITTAKHRDSYWLGFNDDSKTILKNLVQVKPPILPQGAPTSPMLANIVATRMDYRFEGLARKMNFNYSRYADDLTFSSNSSSQLPSLSTIKNIIEEEGFFINKEKIKYMKKGAKQYVTGLSTTNGINVSKRYRKNISEHIYYCRKFGVNSHLAARKEEFPNFNPIKFHNWLYGHICFINSINKKASKILLEDFNKIDWFL
ncbi:reverse transcriptase family protein [Flavobacterium beibuense]|uniref:reverse transcriptase family protein n=1 Tax=Flavobacterium beibuense TaxID=657326 RepID=UPI003A92C912